MFSYLRLPLGPLLMARHEWPLLLAGLLATFCGVGMARFAYTALMPQLVHAGWYTDAEVATLSVANLMGYPAGALLASAMAQRWGAQRVLTWSWVGVALSFAACSWPQPMALFFGWRLLSGVTGALLMVLGTSVAMAALAPARRASLGPVMFCGIGLGALVAGTTVPWLAAQSLGWAWWALAVLCALAAAGGICCVQQLPAPIPAAIPAPIPAPNAAHAPPPPAAAVAPLWTAATLLVLLAYGMDGLGFVPHTVFWVDYLDRELALGTPYAATQWVIFGVGAMAGPLCVAFGAQRWGWGRTAAVAYALKAVAVGLPLLWPSMVGHAVSGAVVGALTPGMSAITSGYLMQLAGSHQHKQLWGYATAFFALLQAIAGVAMASAYVHTGSYRSLFAIGAMSLAAGLVLILLSMRYRTQN